MKKFVLKVSNDKARVVIAQDVFADKKDILFSGDVDAQLPRAVAQKVDNLTRFEEAEREKLQLKNQKKTSAETPLKESAGDLTTACLKFMALRDMLDHPDDYVDLDVVRFSDTTKIVTHAQAEIAPLRTALASYYRGIAE